MAAAEHFADDNEVVYFTNDPASPRHDRGYAAGAANMNVTAMVNTSGATPREAGGVPGARHRIATPIR